MTTELAPAPPPVMKFTAADVKADVNLIQTVLRQVMKKDVHYGVIPGCKKPSLYKPGAEKIMVTFRLNGSLESASGQSLIEDLSTAAKVRYRVRVRIIHQITGAEIGWGVGECSSDEEKYKWEKAVSLEQYNATPENERRLKYYKEGKPAMQVLSPAADVANTVLKMAKKRALVDATLTSTSASDVFDQDMEDMPEGVRSSVSEQNRPPMPQAAAAKPAQQPAPGGEEEPPVEKKANLGRAADVVAKFDAPCKLCHAMLKAGTDILYVGDGSDKGRYCVGHRA